MKDNGEENVSPQQRNPLCSGLTPKNGKNHKIKESGHPVFHPMVSYAQKKWRRNAFGFACVSLVALQSAFSGQGQVKAEKKRSQLL